MLSHEELETKVLYPCGVPHYSERMSVVWESSSLEGDSPIQFDDCFLSGFRPASPFLLEIPADELTIHPLADHLLYCRPDVLSYDEPLNARTISLSEAEFWTSDMKDYTNHSQSEKLMDEEGTPWGNGTQELRILRAADLDWMERFVPIPETDFLPIDPDAAAEEVDWKVWEKYLGEPEKADYKVPKEEEGSFGLKEGNQYWAPGKGRTTGENDPNEIRNSVLMEEEDKPTSSRARESLQLSSQSVETQRVLEKSEWMMEDIESSEGGAEEAEDDDDPEYSPESQSHVRRGGRSMGSVNPPSCSSLSSKRRKRRGRPFKDPEERDTLALSCKNLSERRRVLNRNAAMRYRERRKREMNAMLNECDSLQQKNELLRESERDLSTRIQEMKEQLRRAGCPFF